MRSSFKVSVDAKERSSCTDLSVNGIRGIGSCFIGASCISLAPASDEHLSGASFSLLKSAIDSFSGSESKIKDKILTIYTEPVADRHNSGWWGKG